MKSLLHVVALLVVGLLGPAAAHDGPHGGPDEVAIRAGKNGEINLRENLTVGTALVARGKYILTHRLDDERHVIVLTAAAPKKGEVPVVHEVPTQLLVSRNVPKRTTLYARELANRRLVALMIEIAGEQAEHVPQAQERAVSNQHTY